MLTISLLFSFVILLCLSLSSAAPTSIQDSETIVKRDPHKNINLLHHDKTITKHNVAAANDRTRVNVFQPKQALTKHFNKHKSIKKTPKRTIQKIIKKVKKNRKQMMEMTMPQTSPTSIYQREEYTSTTEVQRKKIKGYSYSKIARYPLPFQHMNGWSRKDNNAHYNKKRD